MTRSSPIVLRQLRDRMLETLSPARLPAELVRRIVGLMRELALGRPVPRTRLDDLWSTSAEQTRRVLEQIEAVGMVELDTSGAVVASVITLRPTAHRFRIGDTVLHTWCAVDTLFMPGVLGATAAVVSTCAETGRQLQLGVAPHRLVECTPPGIHVSLVVPGITPGIDACCHALTGTCGTFCSNVHFLADAEAAESWRAKHPGHALLPVDEAFALAAEIWTKPLLAAIGE